MKPSIFITRALTESSLNKLRTYFEVFVNLDDRVLEKQEIISNVKNKDAFTKNTRCSYEMTTVFSSSKTSSIFGANSSFLAQAINSSAGAFLILSKYFGGTV